MGDTITARPARVWQREDIEAEIRTLIDGRSARALLRGEAFARLWATAAECVIGGKLVRPRLLLAVYEAFLDDRALGPTPASCEAAVRVAAAIELLHFSFLLHDDVIDEDLTRRGAPNLVGRLLTGHGSNGIVPVTAAGNRLTRTERTDPARLHWARSSGMLIGDLMLADAHQAFARVSLPQQSRLRLLDLLDHVITDSVAGEYWDVGLADGVLQTDLDGVLEMTRMKTASYSFELPLRAAAILVGADPSAEDDLGVVGRELGIAFQLQDDLLSAFGHSAEHGKDPYSDFREGKETALIAFARSTDVWPRIAEVLGSPEFSESDGLRVRGMLTRCGAERFVRSVVQERMTRATRMLNGANSGIPEPVAHSILTLADALRERRV